jgi:hypothetical protein
MLTNIECSQIIELCKTFNDGYILHILTITYSKINKIYCKCYLISWVYTYNPSQRCITTQPSTIISYDILYLSNHVSYKIEDAECDSLGLYRVSCKTFGIPEKFIMII